MSFKKLILKFPNLEKSNKESDQQNEEQESIQEREERESED
jgi:hypothetical protein